MQRLTFNLVSLWLQYPVAFLSLQIGTSKVIYAYGDNDEDVLSYHTTRRGARSLNLLNYVKNSPVPASAKHFDVMINKVRFFYYRLSFGGKNVGAR